MTSFPPSINVRHLSLAYRNGHLALDDVNCVVKPGSITALVGPNGGGKSTLFKAIMGFLAPGRGNVQIGNLTVALAQKQQLLAYVPQGEEVDWQFPVSVFDVVLMGRYGRMNFLRIPSRGDRQLVRASLTRVGLEHLAQRQIGELSGGQKKRVFLARALAQQSRVMLLDEPFTGVDKQTEAEIINLLLELRQQGHTMLVSTHDLASIDRFCDQTILLNRTVVAAGPTPMVLTPANLSLTFTGLPPSPYRPDFGQVA